MDDGDDYYRLGDELYVSSPTEEVVSAAGVLNTGTSNSIMSVVSLVSLIATLWYL